MTTRYVIVAMAVVLWAGALLYATDYTSFMPTASQSAYLHEGR